MATAQATVTDWLMVIDGHATPSASGDWIEVRSPATGELAGRVPAGTPADVDRAVAAGPVSLPRRSLEPSLAAGTSGHPGAPGRSHRSSTSTSSSALEVAQTGTALKFRRDNDMPFAADNLRQMATAVRHLEGKAAAEYSSDHTSLVRREPLGVCGQVTPWNYPFAMAVWKIGPALAAGNTVVLKPATRTPLTTLRLGQLALEAGVPPGVLNIVTGAGARVGAAIAAHPDVDLVSLTGDTETGKRISVLAAGNLKRVHLELGGKAPFIVYADADLEAAARGAVAGGYINAGQDCTAATRLYVQRPILETFLARLVDLARSVRVGDPRELDTDMGSLISTEQVERVHGFVERARASGARILCGGQRAFVAGLPDGAFYEATVIADVAQDAECVQQEIFGPVVVALPFDSEDAGAGHGQRHALRPGQLGVDDRCVQGHAGRQSPRLRRGLGERPHPHRLGHAPRRLQAIRLGQGHVRLFVRGVHPRQARHDRADRGRREALALPGVRRRTSRLSQGRALGSGRGRSAARGGPPGGPSIHLAALRPPGGPLRPPCPNESASRPGLVPWPGRQRPDSSTLPERIRVEAGLGAVAGLPAARFVHAARTTPSARPSPSVPRPGPHHGRGRPSRTLGCQTLACVPAALQIRVDEPRAAGV